MSGSTGHITLLFLVVGVFINATAVLARLGDSCVMPSGQRGTCKALLDCPEHVALVRAIRERKKPKSSYTILQQLICSFQGIEPLLCCPQGTTSVPHDPRRPGGSCDRHDLLPQKCGQIAPDRIVGGVDAAVGSWPWMVLLYGRETPSSDPGFFCGGTLISSRYVLTAAHCIPHTNAVSTVRLGEHTKSRDIDCTTLPSGRTICAPKPQDIRPTTVTIHSEFNKPGCRYCNDIALIRLSRPASISNFVSPVCLPVNPQRDLGFTHFNNKVGTVTGWGSVTKNVFNAQIADSLQQARLRLQTCNFSSKKVLCAMGNGADTCRGDSGGPFLLSDVYQQKFYQVGITSTGSPVCASPNIQSQYTDVTKFICWILDHMTP